MPSLKYGSILLNIISCAKEGQTIIKISENSIAALISVVAKSIFENPAFSMGHSYNSETASIPPFS